MSMTFWSRGAKAACWLAATNRERMNWAGESAFVIRSDMEGYVSGSGNFPGAQVEVGTPLVTPETINWSPTGL